MELPPFPEFPTPERLSRNQSPRSVTSGLTDASPVSHYIHSLATRTQASTKIATVVRNPWRQPPGPICTIRISSNCLSASPHRQETN
jgi:hypothetical protein